MADFDEGQIKNFVNNWFADSPVKPDACLDDLENNDQLKELASIPLLLTLLCIAYEGTMNFPKSKAELYKEAIDALLKNGMLKGA